jgi:hypothetical protein
VVCARRHGHALAAAAGHRAGIHGKFTETLGSSPALLSTTFKTSTARSRVHRALDGL